MGHPFTFIQFRLLEDERNRINSIKVFSLLEHENWRLHFHEICIFLAKYFKNRNSNWKIIFQVQTYKKNTWIKHRKITGLNLWIANSSFNCSQKLIGKMCSRADGKRGCFFPARGKVESMWLFYVTFDPSIWGIWSQIWERGKKQSHLIMRWAISIRISVM